MSTLKVACIQINSGNDIAANIAKVGQMVSDAAGAGAQLVALPENVFLMEEHGKGMKRILFTEEEHQAMRASSALARKHHCWLLVGSIAIRIDESGKSVNRSILFNPQGEVARRYDKIHLFDVELPSGETYAESSRILPGTQAIIADTPWAKIGLTICYDVRFPQLYRQLAKAGATILTVPAAFTAVTGEAHWHVLLRARAIENGCFVLAPAQTGTHPGGRKTFGHALIIDPWGRVLADAGTQEGIISAELDMGMVLQVRGSIPSLQHDREFTLGQVP
jgi:deaminated glutathione amidase